MHWLTRWSANVSRIAFPAAGQMIGLMKRLFACLLLLIQIRVCHSAELMEGDLIFHESKSAQSKAVQAATGSKFSHMGMIVQRSGKPHVLEAAGTVNFTPLAQWIARGEGGRYTVKRLKERAKVLTPEALAKASAMIKQLAGKPYDLTFEWSDDRIYCSELVWKIYDKAAGVQIGTLQKLKEFKLDAPEVRPMLKQRYGDNVPLEEPVISPVAMFDSQLLEVVEAK